MHVIISIDDTQNGSVSIKTLTHPAIIGDAPTQTPATRLGDFLMKAVDRWQRTQNMQPPQARQFVQPLVNDPAKRH